MKMCCVSCKTKSRVPLHFSAIKRSFMKKLHTSLHHYIVSAMPVLFIDIDIFLARASDKRGIEDYSKIIFFMSQQNICCDPSLEPSQ